MCRQLAVSRTGYCQWRERVPSPRAHAQATPDARVAAIHADRQRRYGRPRILRELHAQGLPVGHPLRQLASVAVLSHQSE